MDRFCGILKAEPNPVPAILLYEILTCITHHEANPFQPFLRVKQNTFLHEWLFTVTFTVQVSFEKDKTTSVLSLGCLPVYKWYIYKYKTVFSTQGMSPFWVWPPLGGLRPPGIVLQLGSLLNLPHCLLPWAPLPNCNVWVTAKSSKQDPAQSCAAFPTD